MDNGRAILEYGRPSRSAVGRAADRAAAALSRVEWSLVRQPLRAHEVFFRTLPTGAAAWGLAWATGGRPHGSLLGIWWPLWPISAVALLVVAAGALVRLLATGRLRMAAACAAAALPVCVASGLVQYERCPHATYLQAFGAIITVEGQACGNQRHFEPWWLRR